MLRHRQHLAFRGTPTYAQATPVLDLPGLWGHFFWKCGARHPLLETMNRTVAKLPGLAVAFDNRMCLAIEDLIARGFAQGSPVLHGRNSMDADVARE